MINKKALFAILIICIISMSLIGCSNKKTELEDNQEIVVEPKDDTQDIGKIYYGEWVIDSVQAYGIGTYSGEDAESLIGKTLTFTEEEASYLTDQFSDIGKVATNPIYTEMVVEENDFVANYRIPLDNLGIDFTIVTEVNVSDSNGNVCTFFIKDDDTLIIYGGGTYFQLNRQLS